MLHARHSVCPNQLCFYRHFGADQGVDRHVLAQIGMAYCPSRSQGAAQFGARDVEVRDLAVAMVRLHEEQLKMANDEETRQTDDYLAGEHIPAHLLVHNPLKRAQVLRFWRLRALSRHHAPVSLQFR